MILPGRLHGTLVSISAWQQPSHRQWIKIISLVIACVFCFPYLTWAFETTSYFQNPGQILFNHSAIEIPAKLATVSQYIPGNQKLVVYIQDLHCNYEVQTNIAGIIDTLAEQCGLKYVGVEGASRPIDIAKLANFPLANVKRQAADYFLKQGKLTGPEVYAATGKHPISLEGIETAALYQQDRDQAAKFLTAESQGYVYDLRESLNAVKAQVYSPRLLALDKKKWDYRQGNLLLLPYATYLYSCGQRFKIVLDGFPNLKKYLSSRDGRLAADVDSDTLFHELERLDQALRSWMYTKGEQAELDWLQHRIDVMERLLNISASREDLSEFQANPGAFKIQRFQEFLAKFPSQADTALDAEVQRLDTYLAEVREFYRVADERSRTFVSNLFQGMKRNQTDIAVLVTGGYHADVVLSELKAQGAACLCLKPRLVRQDIINPYFDLLQSRKTPLEKLLAKDQSILAIPTALGEKGLPPTETARLFTRSLVAAFFSLTLAVGMATGNIKSAAALDTFMAGVGYFGQLRYKIGRTDWKSFLTVLLQGGVVAAWKKIRGTEAAGESYGKVVEVAPGSALTADEAAAEKYIRTRAGKGILSAVSGWIGKTIVRLVNLALVGKIVPGVQPQTDPAAQARKLLAANKTVDLAQHPDISLEVAIPALLDAQGQNGNNYIHYQPPEPARYGDYSVALIPERAPENRAPAPGISDRLDPKTFDEKEKYLILTINGRHYGIATQPMPIFKGHLVIVTLDRRTDGTFYPQVLTAERLEDMRLLQAELSKLGYALTYNDQGVGASNPTHFHMQAVPWRDVPLLRKLSRNQMAPSVTLDIITNDISTPERAGHNHWAAPALLLTAEDSGELLNKEQMVREVLSQENIKFNRLSFMTPEGRTAVLILPRGNEEVRFGELLLAFAEMAGYFTVTNETVLQGFKNAPKDAEKLLAGRLKAAGAQDGDFDRLVEAVTNAFNVATKPAMAPKEKVPSTEAAKLTSHEKVVGISRELVRLIKQIISEGTQEISVEDVGSSNRSTYLEQQNGLPEDFDVSVLQKITESQAGNFAPKLVSRLRTMLPSVIPADAKIVYKIFPAFNEEILMKISIFPKDDIDNAIFKIDIDFVPDDERAEGIRNHHAFFEHMEILLSNLPETQKKEGREYVLSLIRQVKTVFQRNGIYSWVEGGLQGIRSEQLIMQLNGVSDHQGTPRPVRDIVQLRKNITLEKAMGFLKKSLQTLGSDQSGDQVYTLPLWNPGSISPQRLTLNKTPDNLKKLYAIADKEAVPTMVSLWMAQVRDRLLGLFLHLPSPSLSPVIQYNEPILRHDLPRIFNIPRVGAWLHALAIAREIRNFRLATKEPSPEFNAEQLSQLTRNVLSQALLTQAIPAYVGQVPADVVDILKSNKVTIQPVNGLQGVGEHSDFDEQGLILPMPADVINVLLHSQPNSDDPRFMSAWTIYTNMLTAYSRDYQQSVRTGLDEQTLDAELAPDERELAAMRVLNAGTAWGGEGARPWSEYANQVSAKLTLTPAQIHAAVLSRSAAHVADIRNSLREGLQGRVAQAGAQPFLRELLDLLRVSKDPALDSLQKRLRQADQLTDEQQAFAKKGILDNLVWLLSESPTPAATQTAAENKLTAIDFLPMTKAEAAAIQTDIRVELTALPGDPVLAALSAAVQAAANGQALQDPARANLLAGLVMQMQVHREAVLGPDKFTELTQSGVSAGFKMRNVVVKGSTYTVAEPVVADVGTKRPFGGANIAVGTAIADKDAVVVPFTQEKAAPELTAVSKSRQVLRSLILAFNQFPLLPLRAHLRIRFIAAQLDPEADWKQAVGNFLQQESPLKDDLKALRNLNSGAPLALAYLRMVASGDAQSRREFVRTLYGFVWPKLTTDQANNKLVLYAAPLLLTQLGYIPLVAIAREIDTVNLLEFSVGVVGRGIEGHVMREAEQNGFEILNREEWRKLERRKHLSVSGAA